MDTVFDCMTELIHLPQLLTDKVESLVLVDPVSTQALLERLGELQELRSNEDPRIRAGAIIEVRDACSQILTTIQNNAEPHQNDGVVDALVRDISTIAIFHDIPAIQAILRGEKLERGVGGVKDGDTAELEGLAKEANVAADVIDAMVIVEGGRGLLVSEHNNDLEGELKRRLGHFSQYMSGLIQGLSDEGGPLKLGVLVRNIEIENDGKRRQELITKFREQWTQYFNTYINEKRGAIVASTYWERLNSRVRALEDVSTP